ncbi:MAG TPA: hypothetical protein VL854_06390 [Nitrososphaeraceae archaeon]|nr:hypothetical protein [Nitrososphaeraceae archaeon]
MPVDYEFLYSFSEQLLRFEKSIRWIGIVNKYGVLLNVEYRNNLTPFMTEEENEEYAANAVKRYKTRLKFQTKIGTLNYAFGRYEKISRVTIPINQDYYLLLTLDADEKNYDDLIMNKINPFINKYKEKFILEEE